MKIFCSPKVLEFFQNDAKGALTQARLNSWLEARELSPGQACMSGQVEHFRFPETELQIELDINWVGFRINVAARLIGAVVNVPGVGLCFFALDLTETHDYQKTLVENASLRQSHLHVIRTFLRQGSAIPAPASSSSEADAPHLFKRMVQHRSTWMSPDMNQLKLLDLPIHQGALCFAPPGAGKTMLGVQRAKDYVEHGLTVAMCTPTVRLAEALKAEFAEQGIADDVRVLTFEDVLASLGLARGEKLVDFEYFRAWCETRKQHQDKGVKKTFKAALQADESLLWQEFEYVLMQTPDWRKPSTAHLSLDEYYGLGEAQSRVSQDQRATIYRSVFAPFLEDIATNPKLYYPPLEAYKLYQQALPSGLQVDALVLDEVQKVHPWVSTCFLKLLKQPLKAGNFFICGDAHQGAECQQLRVSETLTNYLVGQEADVLIGHLLVNYRSSQAVTRLVLQTHAIEMALLGSMEKTTHLHPKVNCDAPEGSVMVMDYDANIKQKIQLDAEAYVLIPNESCREAAVQRWPAGQVVTLSEFAGLSGETIVMYGFGDYFQKDIGDIGALFADVPLPSWDTHSAFARRGIDYAQRTCLQSIYTAASRAMVSLYIIDSRPGFLRQIVANSCPDAPVAAAAATAKQISTPQDWFERARKDFRNGLDGQARETLLDKDKMGDAYQKINEALQSYGLAAFFSVPFQRYLPVEMAPQPSAAGRAYKRAGSQSLPPVASGQSDDRKDMFDAGAAVASAQPCRRDKSKSPPPAVELPASLLGLVHPAAASKPEQKIVSMGALISQKEQEWVNIFVPTKKNLQALLQMKYKRAGFREHLLFVAEVGDSKKSIFIKFLEAGMIVEFIDTIAEYVFLAEITPSALNHLSQSKAYLNVSLAMILCHYPNGRVLLSNHHYDDLAAKINEVALNAVLPQSAGPDEGQSAAYHLCVNEDGRELLRDNPDLAAKIKEGALNVVLPKSAEADAGKSAVYFLCANPDGRKLLIRYPDLASKINDEAFNTVLPKSAKADEGKSAAYHLCVNPDGRELLRDNPDLASKINDEAFNTVLPKAAKADAGISAAFVLCGSLDGRELLRDNPDLAGKINEEALNAVLPKAAEANTGKSAVYFLCANPDGVELLIRYPDLASKINEKAFNTVLTKLAEANAGKSAVYFLCGNQSGRNLLRDNRELAAKIDIEALNAVLPKSAGPEEGMSGAFFLCGSLDGRDLLRDNPDLAGKINEEALNAVLPKSDRAEKSARADAGKSAVYFLCGSLDGRELLIRYPDLASKINNEALNAVLPKSAEAERGMSGAYYLCVNPDGRELLIRYPDLASKINNEALNTVLPESAGPDEGKSGAYFLCANPDGRELLIRYPDLASKINDEALNTVLPESAGPDEGMSGAFLLCGSLNGRELLIKYPDLASKINEKALNAVLPQSAGPDEGKSAVYFLCGNQSGRNLLRANPELVAKINEEALNAVLPELDLAQAGKSAAYFLLTTPDGRSLLKSNDRLCGMITTDYLNSIFEDNKCESIESWLANYNEKGELASNSPGAASVSMFAANQESSSACSPKADLNLQSNLRAYDKHP